MRRRRAQLAGAACACALAALPALAQTPAPSAAPFIVGMGQSIQDRAETTAALRSLDVHSVRLDARWQYIEESPGQYRVPAWLDAQVDAARAAGIEPVLILAYGNPLYGGDKPRTPAAIAAFARYAVHVTRHFKGRVRYFDLWNEWNTPTGNTTPGTADEYVEFARRVYPAMKSENPDAIVLSGGITTAGLRDGWLERFVEIGGLRFVDGLSVHPYNYLEPSAGAPERAIAELDQVHEWTVAAGRPMQIYVTEMGYPAYGGRGGVSREVAALYLARFMLLASTRAYVGGVWWYSLRDQGNNDPDNKEHHFGVFDSTLEPKPAADALRDVVELISKVGRFRDESRGSERRVAAARADGTEIVLEWSADGAGAALLRDLRARVTRPKASPKAPELRSSPR